MKMKEYRPHGRRTSLAPPFGSANASQYTSTNSCLIKRDQALLPAATKLGQGNIFTSVCQEFCPQGGEGVCLSACWDTPPWEQTLPPEQTSPPPSRHSLPQSRHPPGADTPLEQTPPREQTAPPQSRHPLPPPREAYCSIRSTSGRYASYWNAFL